jgi:hypothetical protein
LARAEARSAIAEALADHGVADVDVTSVTLHLQTVLQSGFVVAEAAGDPQPLTIVGGASSVM